MKNAVIAALVSALVASGSTFAATGGFNLAQSQVVVRSQIVTTDSGGRGFASASCPSGAFATGGGVTTSDIAGNEGTRASVTDSVPSPIGSRKALGWSVAVQGDPGTAFQAYAVCVR